MAAGFIYEELPQGIKIVACKGRNPAVVIPGTIDKKPVVELDAYAFSSGRRGVCQGKWWQEEDLRMPDETDFPFVSGSSLEEIHLPETLKKIGAYAFYNCDRLKRIFCTSTVEDIGAGVFTGCKNIALLDIRIVEGEKSCLKEMLTELKQTLWVRYRGKEEAVLLFPEYYEESVENTPARILANRTHGCGHRYRYCFQGTQFQFRDYDSVFPYLKVTEPVELVVQMVMARLFYPCGLTGDSERQYWEYLEEHKLKAVQELAKRQDIEKLRRLLEEMDWTREELEKAVDLAAREGHTQVLSYFMDFGHKKFPPVRKKFQL